jgi:hypothetical protein
MAPSTDLFPDDQAPVIYPKISQSVFLVCIATVFDSHALFLLTDFQGVVWTTVALSAVTVLARCLIKLRYLRRLYSDDITIIVSFILFLANVIYFTVASPILYRHYEMLQGKRPFDLDHLARYGSFAKSVLGVMAVYHTSLWGVKLALLLFFRRLGHQIRRHEIWWWCVTAVTILTWIASLADQDWVCGVKSTEWVMRRLTNIHLYSTNITYI